MIQIPPNDIERVMRGVIERFLIPKFLSLGMNATGDWINALEARADENTGEIWGLDYTEYLVNGRPPSEKKPPIAPLVRWATAKLGVSGQQAVSVAFAVSNKIAKEGTSYYPSGTDLLEVLESKEVSQYIYTELGASIAGQVRALIVRDLKNVFA